MATTIRMARHGAKKHPFYRIVVTDSRAPRDGRRLDQVGTYDPGQKPSRIEFQAEKLALWLSRGARPSATVAQLIKRSGVQAAAATPASAVETQSTTTLAPGEAET